MSISLCITIQSPEKEAIRVEKLFVRMTSRFILFHTSDI